MNLKWQARRDSNPQPVDLESTALPLELLTYACGVFTLEEAPRSSFDERS